MYGAMPPLTGRTLYDCLSFELSWLGTVLNSFNPMFGSSSMILRVIFGESAVTTGDHPINVNCIVVLGEDIEKPLSIRHNI